MVVFAATIFVAAFLLFQVQPLIARYILPWFGGSPAVWSTCMLFFQAGLLGGYLYAHALTTYLAPKRQALVHVLLLLVSGALLPITPGEQWKPLPGEDPSLSVLVLLLATVGFPYLLLSATGPLLQRWFGLVHPGRSPYRLYALSNLASLLGLVTYPFLIEPRVTVTNQTLLWSGGYLLFAAVCLFSARTVFLGQTLRHTPPSQEPPPKASERVNSHPFLWISLSAAGRSCSSRPRTSSARTSPSCPFSGFFL